MMTVICALRRRRFSSSLRRFCRARRVIVGLMGSRGLWVRGVSLVLILRCRALLVRLVLWGRGVSRGSGVCWVWRVRAVSRVSLVLRALRVSRALLVLRGLRVFRGLRVSRALPGLLVLLVLPVLTLPSLVLPALPVLRVSLALLVLTGAVSSPRSAVTMGAG